MPVKTPLEIVESYADLLIMQYRSKPKARATISALASAAILPQTTVQAITFSEAPTSGSFVLSYNGESTTEIAWDADASAVQAALRSLTGLGSVEVTGVIADLSLVVTFVGVIPPAQSLLLESNTLEGDTGAVDITIEETDETLPLAVQNAFNFAPGSDLARGVQLDVIGKYAGVSRTGLGFSGTSPITLDDTDFVSLIKMAILRNQASSSLADMQDFVHSFFPDQLFIFDHADMSMTYVISTTIGSDDLIQLFLSENLLPAPMGVEVFQVYFVPSANLFSFRTYEIPNTIGSPFNTYADYQLDWPWLSYQNIVTA